MAKETSFDWVLENIEEHPSFIRKAMFGGVAIYLHGLLGLVMMESPGEKTYRGQEYPFEIWNGILIPTYFEHQQSLMLEFSVLKQHPVLKKWLYLPLNEEDFENVAEAIVRLLKRNDPRIGVVPKPRKSLKSRRSKVKKSKKRSHAAKKRGI